MRLLRVTTLYPEYLDAFYAARPGLDREPYAVQRARLDEDFFGWADSWGKALAPLGWETLDVALNATALQRAWAAEHLPRGAPSAPGTIAVEQARAFRPDLLWYDHDDAALLQAIRGAAPVRGVAGWTGSAIGRTEAWRGIDLMLSCAPEAVERCEREGLRAAVLQHAFDPRILDRLRPAERRYEASFIGQLIDAEGFHRRRIEILRYATANTSVALFVPRPQRSWRSSVRTLLTGARIAPPLSGLRPEQIYGLAMYQVLRDSGATLNIHADSSPRFASNMRLFEATGVGTCLLTDGKENLATLFEPDREVVAYRSGAELVDALRRLAGDPGAARAIAEAGQRRALAAHTFAHRAPDLDAHLRGLLR